MRGSSPRAGGARWCHAAIPQSVRTAAMATGPRARSDTKAASARQTAGDQFCPQTGIAQVRQLTGTPLCLRAPAAVRGAPAVGESSPLPSLEMREIGLTLNCMLDAT